MTKVCSDNHHFCGLDLLKFFPTIAPVVLALETLGVNIILGERLLRSEEDERKGVYKTTGGKVVNADVMVRVPSKKLCATIDGD